MRFGPSWYFVAEFYYVNFSSKRPIRRVGEHNELLLNSHHGPLGFIEVLAFTLRFFSVIRINDSCERIKNLGTELTYLACKLVIFSYVHEKRSRKRNEECTS